jgi:hypothetical protein
MMKKALALAIAALCGGSAIVAAHDSDAVVGWRNIVGVITAPGIDNPVAVITDNDGRVVSQIHSGTLPWTTRTGWARVDLRTGAIQFRVRGLVLNGGNASGTAGPINQVKVRSSAIRGVRTSTNHRRSSTHRRLRSARLGPRVSRAS